MCFLLNLEQNITARKIKSFEARSCNPAVAKYFSNMLAGQNGVPVRAITN